MKSFKISVFIYLLILAVFFIFRLLLFLVNLDSVSGASFGEVLMAFANGLRFDTTTITYIITIPVLTLIATDFAGKMPNPLKLSLLWFISILSCVAFLVCAADIPYYGEFVTRFNVSALNEFTAGNAGNVAKMILSEPKFLVYLIPFVGLSVLFVIVLRKILDITKSFDRGQWLQKTGFSVLLIVLVFFGMRGRVDFSRKPLTLNDAFFCSNHFLNQLGLNPNYVLIRSAREKMANNYFADVDADKALAEVQRQLGITEPSDDGFPLSRKVPANSPTKRYNIVVVLMESMKAGNMAHFGNIKNITPTLDSLADNGLFFNTFYSQNTRTCYGIFSTLTAFPAMWPGNPLYATPLRPYESLPSVLQHNGYSTAAVIPHERDYDNLYGFCSANGIDTLLSLEDYPKSEVANTWGIPDHLVFAHTMQLIDGMYAKGKPFFINVLTVSNHLPFVLPPSNIYTPAHPNYNDEEKEIEYADFAIGDFLKKASAKPWYDSTIFVFLGDHGKPCDTPYPISLDFVHVPLIIYCPSLIQPKTYEQVASQVDVFPTLMGLMGIGYNNSTFGMDLTKQPRKYAYFMNGDKYGVVDHKWLYISDLQHSTQALYRYMDSDTTNYISTNREKATEMKTFGESNWKTAIVLNGNRIEVSRFLR